MNTLNYVGESMLDKLNAMRPRIDFLIQSSAVSFSVGELLDPDTDITRFAECIGLLHPFYMLTKHERAEETSIYTPTLWGPLLTYFIETNQFDKYMVMFTQNEKNAHHIYYDYMLYLVSKYKPANFAKFFGYTLQCFCFLNKGRCSHAEIDGEVLMRDDMKEITKWMKEMGIFDARRNLVRLPEYDLPHWDSEKGRDLDDEAHEELWKRYNDEAAKSLELII